MATKRVTATVNKAALRHTLSTVFSTGKGRGKLQIVANEIVQSVRVEAADSIKNAYEGLVSAVGDILENGGDLHMSSLSDAATTMNFVYPVVLGFRRARLAPVSLGGTTKVSSKLSGELIFRRRAIEDKNVLRVPLQSGRKNSSAWAPLTRRYRRRKPVSTRFWRKTGNLGRAYNRIVTSLVRGGGLLSSYAKYASPVVLVSAGPFRYKAAFDLTVPNLHPALDGMIKASFMSGIARRGFVEALGSARAGGKHFRVAHRKSGPGVSERFRVAEGSRAPGKHTRAQLARFERALSDSRGRFSRGLFVILFPEKTRPWIARFAKMTGTEFRRQLKIATSNSTV